MKFKLNSLLKDKKVLYIVFFLAVVNLFSYLIVGNLDAVTLFVLVGFLTSYFSKNMIVIMLFAMILTNFFVSSRYIKNKKLTEGFDGKSKNKKQNKKQNIPVPADEDEDEAEATGKPKIDYSSTVEAAYDNIDKLLNSDALNNMSNETQRLAEKQEKLMGNIEKLEPMMKKAGSILEGLDMEKMTNMIGGLEAKIGGMVGDAKTKK